MKKYSKNRKKNTVKIPTNTVKNTVKISLKHFGENTVKNISCLS